jgi:hypothetical protein
MSWTSLIISSWASLKMENVIRLNPPKSSLRKGGLLSSGLVYNVLGIYNYSTYELPSISKGRVGDGFYISTYHFELG